MTMIPNSTGTELHANSRTHTHKDIADIIGARKGLSCHNAEEAGAKRGGRNRTNLRKVTSYSHEITTSNRTTHLLPRQLVFTSSELSAANEMFIAAEDTHVRPLHSSTLTRIAVSVLSD